MVKFALEWKIICDSCAIVNDNTNDRLYLNCSHGVAHTDDLKISMLFSTMQSTLDSRYLLEIVNTHISSSAESIVKCFVVSSTLMEYHYFSSGIVIYPSLFFKPVFIQCVIW